MAVTSGLTTFENFENSPSYLNIGSGGGASDNTDVFIEGSQSGGRRVDNATNKGFMASVTAVDLSAAGEHVKIWIFCFHWTQVTAFSLRLRSGTDVFDNHTFPTANIPTLGGWIPAWVDVSKTPASFGSGGSADESAITDIGAFITIGNVGGAGDNFIIDEIMYGTDGLTWSGSGGDMDDFRSYEDTNVEGNLVNKDGVDFVYSRLTIGDSAATVFNDSGFQIVFPNQTLVSTTFMGITIDLQNASTDVDLTNASISSGDPVNAIRRPDLLVTGTSGAFDMDTCTLNGLRTIVLNGSCSLTNSTILNTGLVDATDAGSNGADLSGTKILDSTVAANASALEWDVNADPAGELDNMTFTKGTNAHHAIEFGLTSPLTLNLNNMTFNGFNASNAQNDSTFHILRTSSTVTINISNSTGNFSYRTEGATVNVVVDPVTLQLTAIDSQTSATISNARTLITADATGPLPFEDSVTITRSGSTATVSHTAHGLENNNKVLIEGADQDEYNGIQTISNVSANAYDFTVSGTPTTPATGTITSTAVIIDGLTNGSGVISDTRTYASDQDFVGRLRKGTSSPFYKTQNVSGTIDSSTGATLNVPMTLDE